jgi:hypothetical protein
MTMSHGMDSHDHSPAHPASMTPDCACAHVTASVPPWIAVDLSQTLPSNEGWQASRETAPQPVYEPPLRPPVV